MLTAGAGDIAGGNAGDRDKATAMVLDRLSPKAVFATGDNAYDNGTLAGYMSDYEPTWRRDKAGKGYDSCTAGTGGTGQYAFGTPQPNSEVRATGQWGVLALTLRPDGYDWKFEPAVGSAFTDHGSATCHSTEP